MLFYNLRKWIKLGDNTHILNELNFMILHCVRMSLEGAIFQVVKVNCVGRFYITEKWTNKLNTTWAWIEPLQRFYMGISVPIEAIQTILQLLRLSYTKWFYTKRRMNQTNKFYKMLDWNNASDFIHKCGLSYSWRFYKQRKRTSVADFSNCVSEPWPPIFQQKRVSG
jgi:hypothetical protein